MKFTATRVENGYILDLDGTIYVYESFTSLVDMLAITFNEKIEIIEG